MWCKRANQATAKIAFSNGTQRRASDIRHTHTLHDIEYIDIFAEGRCEILSCLELLMSLKCESAGQAVPLYLRDRNQSN